MTLMFVPIVPLVIPNIHENLSKDKRTRNVSR